MVHVTADAERWPASAGAARGGGSPSCRQTPGDQGGHRRRADDATWAALGRYLATRTH